ncbi:MAG: hypothetical protein ACXVQQ_04600 [Gaiellaceae bacterium]
MGGAPIQAGSNLSTNRSDVGSLHPGEVVVATLGSAPGHSGADLLAAVRRVARAGLAVSSVQRLASAAHSS